jgi:hypothetical protein
VERLGGVSEMAETAIKTITWRRRELIDTIINECLSGGLGKIEDMWLMLTVAKWTKDAKFAEYALMTMEVLKYDREDVKATARAIAEEIKRLKDKTEFYLELESKARREFYDLLAKCLAENLPF